MHCSYAPLNASREGGDGAAQWACGTRVGLRDTYGLNQPRPVDKNLFLKRTGWRKHGRAGHSPPSPQPLPAMPQRLGYRTPAPHTGPAWAGASASVGPARRGGLSPPGCSRLASVTSSVYRRVNRCLQRETLNFDIPHKDANTSPQKRNPEY